MADESVNEAAAAFETLLGGEPEAKETPAANAPSGDEEPSEVEGEEPTEGEPTEGEPAEPTEGEETDTAVSTLNDLAAKIGVDVADLYKITIPATGEDGRTELSLSELKDAWQEQAKIAKQASALEEKQRAVDAQHAQAAQMWDQRIQESSAVFSYMAQQLEADIKAVDWTALRAEDPAEYAAKRQEFTDRQQGLHGLWQNATQQYEQAQQEQQAAQRKGQEEFIKAQSESLRSALPAWKDEAVAGQEKVAIREYLSASGFSADEIGNIADHRAVIIARKAMLFDAQQKKIATAKKKVVALPKVQKPGSGQSAAHEKAERRAEQMKALRKSGSTRDAAALFLDMV